MTKARDLAGFASSSVTTTASDGLVLKGDGSTTDVVIKNGANATVASVADGTVNIAAAGSITATGASVGALARGSIQVGNSSGVAAALARGTSGYVLTAGANDLSWAEVPSSDPTLPSVPNWASPTNTYTASGTWSKGGLADSAFVWFYLLGGGGGGNGANGEFHNFGGSGGGAVLIHATAAILNGAAYVIGAGAAGTTASNASNPTETKLTLSDGRIFSTTNASNRKAQTIGTSGTTTNFQQTVPDPVVITIKAGVTEGGVTMTDSTAFFSESPSGATANSGRLYSVFGGGSGKGTSYQTTSGGTGATSTYAGTGGSGQAGPNGGSGFTAGSYPGGGGGSRNAYSSGGASVGGAGANGNVRVYHV